MAADNATHYDAVVIGAGQSGKPLTVALAKQGKKTAIIEREHVGGTCINTGCTPTKTMVASARVAYLARRAADYGVHVGETTVNMAEVRGRKRAIVDEFRGSGEKQLESTDGLTLIRGEAVFTGAKSLDVRLNAGGTEQITADLIFINVGARSAKPPIPGLDTVPTLDSTSIMELDDVPEHLLILGGGYIALEFGQMFRRFGSRITIVERGGQVLAREDEDVAQAVTDILREDGVEILVNAEVVGAEKADGGQIAITCKTGGETKTLTGSHLLVAVGRTPNTERLGAEAAGLTLLKGGFIQANEHLETNIPGVYALGDVKGGPAFTHISYDDYRIICANVLGSTDSAGSTATTGRDVPYTVFIDPQLGRIGLSEKEARESGRNFRVAKIPMNYVARALETDEPRGMMKAIVDADTGHILGCAILGIEGGEIASMIQIAMMGKLHYRTLRDGIFSHPTLSEALNTLFDESAFQQS